MDEEDIEKILQQKVDLKDGDEDEGDVDKKINDALKKEKVWCMCWHNQKMKMWWDLIVIILAIYNAIMIPFEFAFSPEYLESTGYQVADYFIDFLFFLDVVINFRTTYVN